MKVLKYITIREFTYLTIMLVVILLMLDKCNTKNFNINTANYEDSTRTYKNKYGEQVARNQVLVIKDFNNFSKLKSKDQSIIELQNLVQRYKTDLKKASGIVYIKGETKIDTVYKTQVLTRDSVGNPTYGFEDNNKWYKLRGRVNYDSTKIEIDIHNEYLIILKNKREGLFRLTPVVDVINQNPYSSTTDVKSIKIDDKRKTSRGGIGFSFGYGITNDAKPRGYIGISYNYTLIRFP